MKNTSITKYSVCIEYLYKISYILIGLIIIGCIQSYIFYDMSTQFLRMLILLNIISGLNIILYAMKNNMKNNFSLFSYTSVFLVYNLGEFVLGFTSDVFGQISFAGTVYYPLKYDALAMLIIFVGMQSFYVSYRINRKHIKFVLPNNYKLFVERIHNVNTLRYWSKLAMYVGAIATFAKLILMILQVQQRGYLSIYTDTSYNIPVLNLFDTFFELGLFAFLATKPALKKCKLPLLLYFLYAFSTLLYGRRLAFMTTILVILWYIIKMDQTKIWKKTLLSGTKIRLLFVAILVGLIGLYYYSVFRLYFGGQTTSIKIADISIIDALNAMLRQFGFTGKVLSLSLFSETKLISLGKFNALLYPITNYLTGNVVSRVLGFGALATQSALQLESRYTFGGWLTYLYWPSAYLSGGGVGTNYLAELYIFGGFLALVIGNFILGYILKEMDLFSSNKWLTNFFAFFSYSIIITLARTSTLEIIPRLVVFTLFTVLLLLISKKK